MQTNNKEKMTPSELGALIVEWAEPLENDIFTNADAYKEMDFIDSPAQVSDALRYLFTSGQVARKKKDGYKYYYALIDRAPDDFELFDGVAYNKKKFNERKEKKKELTPDVKPNLKIGVNLTSVPKPDFGLASCCDEQHERLNLIKKIVSKREFAGYLKCLAINELIVSGNKEKADHYANFLSDSKFGDTININGFEVPEPVREELEPGCDYYIPSIPEKIYFYTWRNLDLNYEHLRDGLIHLTRKNAQIHSDALVSFTKRKD